MFAKECPASCFVVVQKAGSPGVISTIMLQACITPVVAKFHYRHVHSLMCAMFLWLFGLGDVGC